MKVIAINDGIDLKEFDKIISDNEEELSHEEYLEELRSFNRSSFFNENHRVKPVRFKKTVGYPKFQDACKVEVPEVLYRPGEKS